MRITASQLWLLERCPGAAYAAQEPGAERKPTPEMERGILLHSACEDAWTLSDAELAERYDVQTIAIAKSAVGSVRQHADELLGRWTVERETRYNPPEHGFPVLVSAKPDAVLFSEDRARWMIVDFKFVSGTQAMTAVVGEKPDSSWQLWAGLAAAIACHDGMEFQHVQEAYLAYVYMYDDATVRVLMSRKMNSEDLYARAVSIHALQRAAQQSDAVRVPGKHCSFCNAKNVCHARLPLTLFGVAQSDPESVMRMNPKIASGIMRLRSQIESAIEGAKAVLLSLPNDELHKLGWRKAEPLVRSAISDVATAFNLLRDSGYTEEMILRACSMSMSKLTRLVAMVDGLSIGEAETKLKSMLQNTMGESEGEPRLAPIRGFRDNTNYVHEYEFDVC